MTLFKILFIINIIFLSIIAENQLTKNVIFDVAENWCCKIELEIELIPQTRQITYYVVRQGRHKCGYAPCGFLQTSRCTVWCSESWLEAENRIETYLVNKTLPCPNDQLRCCPNHLYIMGHCMSSDEIHNNLELLMQLNELDIVLPGPNHA
ncbi:unnamed protein product [Rotaria sp. Silwood1]|nr:unnamed protein product [Rotaria sp. Silwood1]CAF3429708.1 unnamed protein product [Rotaria sp. Silwood1]CAF4769928.1 unnamed protein product [Rotaria sp. Silwood1]CAF4918163.1 unnamed protein product [Rotaria sp. Silwood1]